MGLLDRSVEMAEAAYLGSTTGAVETKSCNVMLGAARVVQGAARQSIASRMAAGRLAFQEAKLIEATKDDQKSIAQQKAA
jgi:hypothetical protein